MRWALLLVLLGVVVTDRAVADEATQREMELLFLEGRMDELDALVDESDPWTAYILAARDMYWRRKPGATLPTAATQGNTSLARRLRWLDRGNAATQEASALDGDARLPILTALLRDRARRSEFASAPQSVIGSDLRTLDVEGTRAIDARGVGVWLLEVHQEHPPSAKEVAETEDAAAIARRNARIGFGAVLALLVACAVLGMLFRPRTS